MRGALVEHGETARDQRGFVDGASAAPVVPCLHDVDAIEEMLGEHEVAARCNRVGQVGHRAFPRVVVDDVEEHVEARHHVVLARGAPRRQIADLERSRREAR
jgi:hypothetical protein